MLRKPNTGASSEASRCWACGSALNFSAAEEQATACASCGARNGVEPRMPRAFESCVFRPLCRSLSVHGRFTHVIVASLILVVIIAGSVLLLPVVTDPTWTAASLRHVGLTVILSVGTIFNFLATSFTGPGYVKTELCPLRRPNSDPGQPNGDASALTRLAKEYGDTLPLRGWRQCEVSGISMPPRSHYCRTCRQVVKRADQCAHKLARSACAQFLSMPRSRGCHLRVACVISHCAFVNTCIGHGNHHYFIRFVFFMSLSTIYVTCLCIYFMYTRATQILFQELNDGQNRHMRNVANIYSAYAEPFTRLIQGKELSFVKVRAPPSAARRVETSPGEEGTELLPAVRLLPSDGRSCNYLLAPSACLHGSF